MKVVKSISFNDKNEKEAQMLKLFKRRSFSKYVKELILADMAEREERKANENKIDKQPEPESKPKPSIYDIAAKKATKKPNAQPQQVNQTQPPMPVVSTPKIKSRNGAITYDFTKGGM